MRKVEIFGHNLDYIPTVFVVFVDDSFEFSARAAKQLAQKSTCIVDANDFICFALSANKAFRFLRVKHISLRLLYETDMRAVGSRRLCYPANY